MITRRRKFNRSFLRILKSQDEIFNESMQESCRKKLQNLEKIQSSIYKIVDGHNKEHRERILKFFNARPFIPLGKDKFAIKLK